MGSERAKEQFRPARHHGLLPLPEVARRWNAMSGEHIGRARVWQILRDAHRKIARHLAAELDHNQEERCS